MNYLELSCIIKPFETGKDILVARLADEGFESFAEEEDVLLAYMPAHLFNKQETERVLKEVSEFFEIESSYKEIADKNWNEEWEKNYDEVIINDLVRIRAPFHVKKPTYKFDIEIKPQMSFGTAHHETTSQMLDVVSALDVHGKAVLDMGCGTAVIAILTALMGAASVTAIDNDEWAWRNSLENAERNHLSSIEILLGDANTIKDRSFNLIIANINRNILLNDMIHYVDALAPDGELWMSGFYEEDLPLIQAKAEEFHLTLISHRSKNRWVVAGFRK